MACWSWLVPAAGRKGDALEKIPKQSLQVNLNLLGALPIDRGITADGIRQVGSILGQRLDPGRRARIAGSEAELMAAGHDDQIIRLGGQLGREWPAFVSVQVAAHLPCYGDCLGSRRTAGHRGQAGRGDNKPSRWQIRYCTSETLGQH